MKIPNLRRSREQVRGVVFFGRMLDEIRLHDRGQLPDGYNLGTGFDENMCGFLGIAYGSVRVRTLEGGTDEDILNWVFDQTETPHPFFVRMWNHYVLKLGDRDETSDSLRRTKEAAGFGDREDIRTWCDFHDADEGWI